MFVEDVLMKRRGIKAVLDNNADGNIFIMLLSNLHQLEPNCDQQIMALCNQIPPNTNKVGLVQPNSVTSRAEELVETHLWKGENRGP